MTLLRSVRVLVVEDNPLMATALRTILRSAGGEVVCAHDPIEALEIFAADPPDLVLLDFELGEINGVEVARRIRETPAGAETPLIMVSGYVDRGMVADAMRAGVDEFIAKPVSAKELLSHVHGVLEGRARAEAGACASCAEGARAAAAVDLEASYDAARGLVILAADSDAPLGRSCRGLREHLAALGALDARRLLIDYSCLSCDLPACHLAGLEEEAPSIIAALRKVKIAAVFESSMNITSGVFSLLFSKGARIAVFQSRGEALDWLMSEGGPAVAPPASA